MIALLRRLAHPRWLRDALKHEPQIRGHFRAETRAGGKLRQRTEGWNIWTLTGREYLAEVIALQAWSPRTLFRDDRVAYIGVGSGAQEEVSTITSLVDPVVYRAGEYLAAIDAPATFPTSGTSTSNTSVRLVREFSASEISLGYDVVLTEAGLFTDGDPDNDWDTDSTPTDFSTAASRAPVAYKTFEPITKTTEFTLRILWDIRFV